MTNQHPITPPLDLVLQWDEEGKAMFHPEYQLHITTQAARWGADQELEACCEWLKYYGWPGTEKLRAARRAKPPSLKGQALAALCNVECDLGKGEETDTIRRALEQLDE